LNHPPASTEAIPRLARVIPRDSHPISRSKIAPEALRVLYRLREAGFEAFLVGGCVRDLMLGLEPKDFDVATDALPEQVKRLFRNCRLVGRRFRLAHVFFGRDIIEVATFRASGGPPIADEIDDTEEDILDDAVLGDDDLDDEDDEDGFDDGVPRDDNGDIDGNIDPDYVPPQRPAEAQPPMAAATPAGGRLVDESGRILRDNVYGSIDEDVWRRDFTCNALYYNIADFSLWDYCGGFEDVQARRLRLIGDPETRYREDPVRMLRAARFEAKLGLSLEPATAEPIPRLRELLGGVPPARLFDETLKLFLTGHGALSYEVLRARGLLEMLLPNVAEFARRHPGSPPERMLLRGLANTDERVRDGRTVTPVFLFALFLYGPVGLRIEQAPRRMWHDTGTILDAFDHAARAICERIAIPRRFMLGVREMFLMQPRLEAPRGRRALRTLEHPRLRAAFDLLQLRAEFGMADPAIVEWWTRLQAASPVQRSRMSDALPGGASGAGASGEGPGEGERGDGRPRGGRRRRGGRSRRGGGRGGAPAG
jgi:poly(A) polymerase